VFGRFVDLGGRSAQQIGFGRSIGQIYAALYLTDKPTGLAELTTLLRIRKGSASMGVRQLLAWGAIRSVWVRGDRKDYYEVNPNFTEVIQHLLSVLINPRIVSAGNQLKELQSTLETAKEEGSPVTDSMMSRIAQLEKLRNKMPKVMPLLESIIR